MTERTAEFVRVAAADEIPPGTGKAVVVDGRRIALFNVNGTFYAIDDTCTHEEASLAAGAVYREIVAGPTHGARFHPPPGRGVSLAAVVPVSHYQGKEEDGEEGLRPLPRPGRGLPH